jgi:PAS domain S-box-containing protein
VGNREAGARRLALRRGLSLAAGAIVFIALYLISRFSYLLFHSLAELFSIVVACAMFLLAWNARRSMANDFLLFLGIAYLAVAGIDLLHTLAYEGMGIFPQGGANLATQLWIGGRYLEAGAVAFSVLFLGGRLRLRPAVAIAAFAAVCTALLLSVFYWRIFPAAYVEGRGLTRFKVLSEYIICAVLAGTLFLMYRNRGQMHPRVFRLLVAAIAVTIASELAFTQYVSVYGFFNLLGHFLKIVSFYLVYKAIIEMGLTSPYETLFRDLKRRGAELERSEARYRAVVEDQTELICRWRLDGTLTFVNDAYCRYFSKSKEELVGHSFLALIPEEDRSTLEQHLRSLSPQSPPGMQEHRATLPGGEIRWQQWSNRVILDESGQAAEIQSVGRDITAQKKAEEALHRARDELERRVQERTADYAEALQALEREFEERSQAEQALQERSRILEAFFGHTITPLVFLDREFNFIRVNEAYARACQREASDFPGHNHFEFYPSDARPIFEEVVRSKKPYRAVARPFEFPDHPEWGVTYWDWELVPLLDQEGEVEFLVFALEDVTQRTRAEARLQELNEALEKRARQARRLAGELLQAEQRERRRLAHVLHDHLQQLLVGAKLRATLIAGQVGSAEVQESATELNDLIQQSIDSSRSLAVEISPPVLYREGLAVALHWLGSWMERKHGLKVAVQAEERADPIKESVSTLLFESARELLFNVVKHAGVKEASLELQRLGEEGVRVAVRDEGSGFDPTPFRTGVGPSSAGFGLFSIQERLDLVGGTMVVESAPGEGSRIVLEVPAATSSGPG